MSLIYTDFRGSGVESGEDKKVEEWYSVMSTTEAVVRERPDSGFSFATT